MAAVDWIAQFIPRVYLHTGKPGLRTFVSVAVSKYRMKQESMVENLLYLLFCISLDSWLQDQISLEKTRNEENQIEEQTENQKRRQKKKQEENQYLWSEWFPFGGAELPVLSNAKHFETACAAHTELKKSHPHAL
jgi:hypothetical protein